MTWRDLIPAVLAAIIVSAVIFAFQWMAYRRGTFSGRWKARYRDTKGIQINEVLDLRTAFRVVWGTSNCTWTEGGLERKGRFKVRGMYQANCIMGVYIPANSDGHDMGVFIALLDAGSSPTSASGLTTNFESSDISSQESATEGTESRRQQPLVARDYRMERPRPGETL